MTVTQGCKANRSGGMLQTCVAAVLTECGIAYVPERDTRRMTRMEEEVRVDFFLPRPPSFPEGLYIECKRQTSPGSARQKIAYTCEVIRDHYDKQTILVIDGSESDWMLRYCGPHIGKGPLLGAMTFQAFQDFAERMRDGSGRSYLNRAFDPSQKRLNF